ncbi:hypothetical protein SAMD00023353_4600150 [Rosellinia necatrix]|uniref:Uncharacterized protein n=1 Tax=Rosellinia necatrix TaxID=77044 RepID=A0A1S8A9H8_ROSNE|nr:hypothetical protein SAMD00023353_4600150 [Rosellinia necatrix]
MRKPDISPSWSTQECMVAGSPYSLTPWQRQTDRQTTGREGQRKAFDEPADSCGLYFVAMLSGASRSHNNTITQ